MHHTARAVIALVGLLWLVACATPRAAAPSGPAPGTFSREDVLQDFDRAAEILLRNPLAFADRSELSRFVTERRGRVRDGMTELDLYRLLTPAVVMTRCGHTGIFLTEATEASLRERERYLPVLVRIADGRLYVLSPLEGSTPRAGSEVTAINRRSTAGIIAELMDNITADGANVTRKLYVASRVFNDLYSLFIDASPVFRIEYRDFVDQAERVSNLAGISRAQLERQAAAAGFPYGLPEAGPAYAFHESEGIGILSVRTFQFPAGREPYERFLDDAFDTMQARGTRTLIIDVRGNWGGDPEASSFLLARLLRQPAPYFEEGTPFYPALTHPITPAPNAFHGKVLVLTDGASFSSTGHLCSLLRFHGLATFIGEETGGSWIATDGSRDYYLPRTGMHLRSSTQAFRAAVTGMPLGRGISPDIEVRPTISDFISARDPVMDRAMSVAASPPS